MVPSNNRAHGGVVAAGKVGRPYGNVALELDVNARADPPSRQNDSVQPSRGRRVLSTTDERRERVVAVQPTGLRSGDAGFRLDFIDRLEPRQSVSELREGSRLTLEHLGDERASHGAVGFSVEVERGLRSVGWDIHPPLREADGEGSIAEPVAMVCAVTSRGRARPPAICRGGSRGADLPCRARARAGGPRCVLAEACAGDERMRREVQSLLRHESKVDGFLVEPALLAAAQRIAEESERTLIGGQIGAYQVSRCSARAAWARSIAPATRS